MKRFAIAIVSILIAIQFIPVSRSNPPPRGPIEAPPEVMAILKRSCYDCHSNETVWPWYSKIAPFKFIIARHVREGREHLNFSEWGKYDKENQHEMLEESLEEIEKGKMPLAGYVLMHKNAKLSKDDFGKIKLWAGGSMSSFPDDNGHYESED